MISRFWRLLMRCGPLDQNESTLGPPPAASSAGHDHSTGAAPRSEVVFHEVHAVVVLHLGPARVVDHRRELILEDVPTGAARTLQLPLPLACLLVQDARLEAHHLGIAVPAPVDAGLVALRVVDHL